VRTVFAAIGVVVASATILAAPSPAIAQGPAPAGAPPPTLPPDAQIQISTSAPEGKTSEPDTTLPEAPPEAPPPRPRHKGVVLETTTGMLAFAGDFRHIAPPAYWLHGQLGYEIFPWLMIFGESELALTDTSEAQGESQTMSFPIFGFGFGPRGTVHLTDRVALFLQGSIGWLEAIVPRDSLAVLGFPNAEALNLSFAGRLGVEWYQVDRHLALVAQGGIRDAQGFARNEFGFPSNDTPLMWDIAIGLRYTF
jgi:hypothetical protein